LRGVTAGGLNSNESMFPIPLVNWVAFFEFMMKPPLILYCTGVSDRPMYLLWSC
jgi:hypothetical protein